MEFGYLRVASASPELLVADIDFNYKKINDAMKSAAADGVSIILFPELSLTGYTCGDLFAQDLLLNRSLEALAALSKYTEKYNIYAVVGLPVQLGGRLYNCAAFVGQGRVLGMIPKIYLPTRKEFYEQRWFTSGRNLGYSQVTIEGQRVPIGKDLLFEAKNISGCTIGIEICEDLWAVEPPSGAQAIAGASVILNPSASNELLGKRQYRKELVKSQAARCLSAYVYASSGPGESSTDLVYSGHCIIAENGIVLAESERFQFNTQIIYADLDLERIQHERRCNSSFSEVSSSSNFSFVDFCCPKHNPATFSLGRFRPNSRTPFVPTDLEVREATCREIFSIQSAGLSKRIRHIGTEKVVIGISGGLDSTLALLVSAHAFDKLGLSHTGILAVTMPGPGTSDVTRKNAEDLVKYIGAELRTIPITTAVSQHLKDIEHDEKIQDVTYENAQARERTKILMDLANQIGGFVVGTGDLSEAALGWCTFNADHMSMYHVNIGVPKTLVKYIIQWCADEEFSGETAAVLKSITFTPISPELLPASDKGEIQHLTEEIIGPYELHDFFLFNVVRHGHRPAKVFSLAEQAFLKLHSPETILKWLEVFLKRFFRQQYKRSVMPDGPKVGTVALSPRGDWRMPSDASESEWLSEVKVLRTQLEEKSKN